MPGKANYEFAWGWRAGDRRWLGAGHCSKALLCAVCPGYAVAAPGCQAHSRLSAGRSNTCAMPLCRGPHTHAVRTPPASARGNPRGRRGQRGVLAVDEVGDNLESGHAMLKWRLYQQNSMVRHTGATRAQEIAH